MSEERDERHPDSAWWLKSDEPPPGIPRWFRDAVAEPSQRVRDAVEAALREERKMATDKSAPSESVQEMANRLSETYRPGGPRLPSVIAAELRNVFAEIGARTYARACLDAEIHSLTERALALNHEAAKAKEATP